PCWPPTAATAVAHVSHRISCNGPLGYSTWKETAGTCYNMWRYRSMPLCACPGHPFLALQSKHGGHTGHPSEAVNSSDEILTRGSDVVLHGVHPRRAPGSLCGLLPFGQGSHAAGERHFATIGANLDVLGLDFGAAIERPLDRVLDISGGRSRLEADQVGNSCH